ncbi:MAG: flotillin family protein, partial [Ferruginibacter sp.]
MDTQQLLATYWWVIVLVISLILYKFILRVFFGMVIVPENRLGLVTKKFVLFGANKALPDGRIIATKGEAGFQGKTLAPGLYWGMWPWQFGVEMQAFTVIPEGKIGLVLSNDGAEIPTGAILGRRVDSDNFQDAQKFLDNGGQKGRQTSYITAGTYRINNFAFTITIADMIIIHENMVGIV